MAREEAPLPAPEVPEGAAAEDRSTQREHKVDVGATHGGDRRDDERRRDDDREKRRDRKERRDRSRSRSRSRDRKKRDRSRSRDRDRRRRSRSRSRDRRSRRRSRSRSQDRRRDDRRSRYRGDSDEGYGYVPRRRGRGGSPRDPPITFHDPFAALRSQQTVALDPAEMARQMQEQQLRARQLVLQQQAASAVAAASKTQREVYVGNLTPGVVTADMLRTLFSSTMSVAFADMCQNGLDPVVNVSLHSEGRYAFVELRSPEMATASLQLNGQVQLLGQVLSIGRPSGYVDPGKAAHAALIAAEALARFQAESQAMRQQQGHASADQLAGEDSCYLRIQGMITAVILAEDKEYNEVLADLHNECSKHGTVLRVVVPRPPVPAESESLMGTGEYGNAYAQFLELEGAQKAKAALSGRIFAGNKVEVTYVQPQAFIDAIQPPPPPAVPAVPAMPAVPSNAPVLAAAAVPPPASPTAAPADMAAPAAAQAVGPGVTAPAAADVAAATTDHPAAPADVADAAAPPDAAA